MRSLRALMWRQVGLERTEKGMTTAQRSLRFWSEHQAKGALHSPRLGITKHAAIGIAGHARRK